MADDPLALWGLDDTALAVYETVLADPGRTIAELAVAVECPTGQLDATLAELASLDLVQVGDGARVRALSPSVAVVRLVRARLRAVADDAARAGELIASIDRVAELEPPRDETEHRLVHATDLVGRWRRVVAMAATDAVVESLSVIPDMSVLNYLPADLCDEFFATVRAGKVRFRCVVSADQLTEMGRLSECAAVGGREGGRIRAARSLPGWFYVIGTSCAGIPRIWGRTPPADTMAHCLITQPGPVAALRALFEEIWRRAMPVHTPDPSPRDHRSVFCLLAQGESDETVARRLGISVRTVRTRVAEAMAELGAHTRFEAAAEAARNGWFD